MTPAQERKARQAANIRHLLDYAAKHKDSLPAEMLAEYDVRSTSRWGPGGQRWLDALPVLMAWLKALPEGRWNAWEVTAFCGFDEQQWGKPFSKMLYQYRKAGLLDGMFSPDPKQKVFGHALILYHSKPA